MSEGQGGSLFQRLRRFDAFPKIRDEEFYQRTFSGGIITIVSGLFMAFLFLSELALFLRVNRGHELVVDTSRGEQIEISMDITFPRMPCSWVSLDVMDVSGEMHLDVDHDVYKVRVDTSGRQIKGDKAVVGPGVPPIGVLYQGSGNASCGSCYGAEANLGDCCNTCDEVREAYRRKGWALVDPLNVAQCAQDHHLTELRAQEGEGCRFHGKFKVNKVAGNFHFAPGKSFQQGYMHLHDLSPFRADQFFDFTHKVDKVAFGAEFPGMINPLDGITRDHLQVAVQGMWQYYLKVVPTVYTDVSDNQIHTNQFSTTEHFKPVGAGSRGIPGVFFFYDLSPIKVRYREQRNSFVHFLTNVCAIVGGVFTVAGLVEAFVYHVPRAIKKKIDLGKMH